MITEEAVDQVLALVEGGKVRETELRDIFRKYGQTYRTEVVEAVNTHPHGLAPRVLEALIVDIIKVQI